ncbi:hypothetical protein DAI22_12g221200 [Oryza sativa Japonica Group]|jgi:hypothetical protein|nr:hypothetical protein DAI22_12g221200 [Oryza sativa Japonica Group]
MQQQLAHIAAVNLPKIPLFHCTLKKTCVEKGKMTFSTVFSLRYLLKHIESSPMDNLMVSMHGSIDTYLMKLMKSQDDRALITTGWNRLVDADPFMMDDVCVFQFTQIDELLSLTIHVLN